MSSSRSPYVWDYNIDEAQFNEMLAGKLTLGGLGQDWAAGRVLEYAPYREIIRLLGFRAIVENWPRWKERVRSPSRRRGLDFLSEWLPKHHPELLSS